MSYNDDLRAAQDRFARHVAFLINFIHSPEYGFTISFGEAFRTEYQQKEYLRTGFSKTMDSKHLIRLAVDFNFFKDGRLLLSDKSLHTEDVALLKPFGEYWQNLHPKNQWGGFWSDAWDAGHFQSEL